MRGDDSGVFDEVHRKLSKLGLRHSREIALYCEAVAREVKPKAVLLTGSVAMGQDMPWSDVDIIVIAEFHEPFLERLLRLQMLNETATPIEAIGYTPLEFTNMFERLDPKVIEALDHGISLLGNHFVTELRNKLKALMKMGLARTSCTYTIKERATAKGQP